jgi:hypothetical protein
MRHMIYGFLRTAHVTTENLTLQVRFDMHPKSCIYEENGLGESSTSVRIHTIFSATQEYIFLGKSSRGSPYCDTNNIKT